ncbi:MAG: M10 family metallopeptidase C-terminal domain-containing protein [Hyphomicrobiales bacterium]
MRAARLIPRSTLTFLLASSAFAGLIAAQPDCALAEIKSYRLSELNGLNGFRIKGETAGDLSGTSVASGDINGDGFSDVIIGAPEADPSGASSGATYVFFGKAKGAPKDVNLFNLNGLNGFSVAGEIAGDRSGGSVSAGDINGDGFDDLIIGAAGDPNGDGSGATYVVFGAAGGFRAQVNLSTLNGTNGFKINGEAAGDRSGTRVSRAGDLNGDGFEDLLITAQWKPVIYLIFGGGDFPAQMELSSLDPAAGRKFEFDTGEGCRSQDVAPVGDVNGDGFDDAVIQHCYNTGYGGKLYSDLLLGAPNPPSGTLVFGPHARVRPAGDFNGDGFDDLTVLRYDNNLVVFGADPPATTPVFGFRGLTTGASTGDMNGDGLDDLLLGSGNAGYVIYGKATGPYPHLDLLDLERDRGFSVLPESSDDALGRSISAGDFNGDGFDDLMIGAPLADPNGSSSGATYVFYGTPTVAVNKIGTDADELLIGGPLADFINGEGGNDRITGKAGSDFLLGGDGDDLVNGAQGDDLLRGQNGRDVLTGGPGADRFSYTKATDTLPCPLCDVITDFEPGKDKIDLRRIDARKGAGNQAFTFLGTKRFTGAGGELRYHQFGGITIVSGDIDGDKQPDIQVKLIGQFALSKSDLRL